MGKICIVKNRSSSQVIYRIPEDNIRREFAPGESRKIDYDELVHLSFQAGGRELMENFLQIDDENTIEELSLRTEPEYFMDEQQVIQLLKEGTIDEFLDCLDYAPMGVLDLVKDYSVKLPLEDYEKRKALKEKLHFDVDKALIHLEEERQAMNDKSDFEPANKEQPAAVKAQTTSGRRTSVNYKENSTSSKKTVSKTK